MTQAHPCLLSVRKISSKYRHFPFLEDRIKIGRSNEMTYPILSETISRCHAIIQKQADNSWTITDYKSLNGISVNDRKLKPLEPYPLQEGDVVQLGVPKDATTPAEFVYRYFSSLKVRTQPKASSQQNAAPSTSSKHLLAVADQNAAVSRKRKAEEAEVEQENKRLKTDFEVKLKALTQQLKEKEKEKKAITQQLQQERQERQAVEKRQKEQEKKVTQMGATQKQLLKEQAAAEAQIRKQLEEQLKEREEQLRRQMQQKLQTLTADKKQVEERLHKEMEKAVREKDEELQNRLQEEKDRLQKVIETKELEQKTLESRLAESREEKEKAKADTLSAREAILSDFADTMENELQCSICSELFVKATSLNCSHVFCALCIRQWLAMKNQCPNCRTKVTSQVRSIVLDNYIDHMVEQLSAERKEQRAVVVAERKEAQAQLDEAEKEEKAGPSGSNTRRRQTRQSGRGRGGQATRRRTRAGSPEVAATVTHDSSALSSSDDDEAGARSTRSSSTPFSLPRPHPEVVLTDEDSGSTSSLYFSSSEHSSIPQQSSSESESESESDSGDEEGNERGYYGGYGRCFSCGRYGHWANQCPG